VKTENCPGGIVYGDGEMYVTGLRIGQKRNFGREHGITTFTLMHVVLSLVGIFSGFVVMLGLFAARPLDGWTALFLATTVATSVTGFLFPFHHFMPS
jgi:hypothetical protein